MSKKRKRKKFQVTVDEVLNLDEWARPRALRVIDTLVIRLALEEMATNKKIRKDPDMLAMCLNALAAIEDNG